MRVVDPYVVAEGAGRVGDTDQTEERIGAPELTDAGKEGAADDAEPKTPKSRAWPIARPRNRCRKTAIKNRLAPLAWAWRSIHPP